MDRHRAAQSKKVNFPAFLVVKYAHVSKMWPTGCKTKLVSEVSGRYP